MVGKIYKITNNYNKKAYIGQTQRPINKRFERHIQDSYNDSFYFHRALQKYGPENFTLDLMKNFLL